MGGKLRCVLNLKFGKLTQNYKQYVRRWQYRKKVLVSSVRWQHQVRDALMLRVCVCVF